MQDAPPDYHPLLLHRSIQLTSVFNRKRPPLRIYGRLAWRGGDDGLHVTGDALPELGADLVTLHPREFPTTPTHTRYHSYHSPTRKIPCVYTPNISFMICILEINREEGGGVRKTEVAHTARG